MKNLWKALSLVYRCAPSSFSLRVVYEVLQSLLPLASLYLLKLLVDSVSNRDFQLSILNYQFSSLHLLLLFCALFLLNRMVSALSGVNNDVLGQHLIDYVSDLLQRQSARLDMQYYDTPAYYDTLHRAQQEASYRPLQVLSNFMSLGGSILSIAGVVIILASATWWVIGVMVVAVLPGFAVRLYKARRIYRFRRDNTQLYRRTSYYGMLLTAREYAKEIRAYALAPLFRGRFREVRALLRGHLLSISRRLGVLDILCGFLEAAAMFAVVWLLMKEAFAGAITIGSFVMLFEAFRRGQGYLSTLVASVAGLYDNRLFMGNLFEFLSLRPAVLSPANPQPVPETVDEVEFRDVTFRYPDMDRDVLSHFSLIAHKGEITHLDGRNGFGKSTLIKLLLRLYDPDQGAVLVAGHDIRTYNPVELRTRIGVLFQDFSRYNVTLKENIAFGTSGKWDAKSKTIDTLASQLGFVGSLPQGADTLLGRAFDGGRELSMGQWQRVALARTLASEAPVLVFDEPTAWLDNTERQRFAALLEELKRDHVVILITHNQ